MDLINKDLEQPIIINIFPRRGYEGEKTAVLRDGAMFKDISAAA
jgi:hypothetical protein